MGAALSLFVLMTISIMLVRIASVALRLTGLDETTAKFQALSAVSGTGFTTKESEAIVNYPVRRKIITLLMIIGAWSPFSPRWSCLSCRRRAR